MVRTRFTMLVVSLVFCLILSGCMKTWSVTFNDQGDIEGWNIKKIGEVTTYYGISEEGLHLDGYEAIAPYAFTGDCTMTVQFYLNCDDSDPWNSLAIYMADENDSFSDALFIFWRFLGKPADEQYFVEDSEAILNTGGMVPNLNRSGLNTVRLSRISDTFTINLNNQQIFSGPFTKYSITYIVPRLNAYNPTDNSASLLIKSIKVQYDGEKLDL